MSQIVILEGGTVFEGQDAILLYKAVTLKGALKLVQRGIRIHRRVGPTRLLEAATVITHKTYKRRDYAGAIADLEQWIAAMKAALPIHDERK
jgi:hypothetical protein